ncbi:MAG: hypothetical protein FJX74_15415 [Armatimonadetes bacterium]|nr:hypothetical protein [Armatimonadota bacterium]
MSARATDLVAPGLYHFSRLSGSFPVRLHLRVDPDGSGLLMANASQAAHLSPVGVVMAQAALEGLDDTQIIARVQELFAGGGVAQTTRDVEGVRKLLDDLLSPDDNYPISNYDGPPAAAERRRLMAPFQAHVAQGEPLLVAPLLQALWNAGVPHVTFLAQPDLPPEGLVRLVECAEDIGMIAGLRTAASWLSKAAIREAAMAGLDFLKLILLSAEGAEQDAVLGDGDHEALLQALAACHDLELCPVAQVPLTDASADGIPEIVEFAAAQGLANLEFFAIACPESGSPADAAGALPAQALPQVATQIAECADECGARFLWAPPVRFDPARSVADHVRAGPRAGAEASIRVEADGTVYAPRGPREPCGNLLRQSWETIWGHGAFARYREGLAAVSRCPTCPGLQLCAAACPKDPTGWSDDADTGGAQ